jgi:hypothetical protein
VGLIEDDEGGLVASFGMLKDLEEETFFSPGGVDLAEGGEDEFEKALGSDLGDVDVDGEELRRVETMDEEPEGRRLAHAGGPGEEGHRAEVGEELEPGEGLRDALVSEQMLCRSGFCEGLMGQMEVLSEHDFRPPWMSGFWICTIGFRG